MIADMSDGYIAQLGFKNGIALRLKLASEANTPNRKGMPALLPRSYKSVLLWLDDGLIWVHD